MTLFVKAEPRESKLSLSLYGPPGSGKTFTALLFGEGMAAARGKRLAMIETERGGSDFYAVEVASRVAHPAAFDYDKVFTKSLAKATAAVREIAENQDQYGCVIVDSMTHLWEAAIAAFEGNQRPGTQIPMHAWGRIKAPYKAFVNALMELRDVDFILCGREKNVFEDDDDGKIRKVGVAMKAEGETPYEPLICAHMTPLREGGGVEFWAEKDRSGTLQGVIKNPTWSTLKPAWDLLVEPSTEPDEDPEEAQAADAELIAEADAKRAKKVETSRKYYDEFSPQIMAATDLDELQKLAKTLKGKRRYLTDDHRKALLVQWESRKSEVLQAALGEGF